MKISNEAIWRLPDSTTPQIRYGSLNPRIAWGDEPLFSMPAGSVYIQQVMAYNEQGDPTLTQGFMWLKSCESGDCGGGSDQSSWVLAGSSSILGGVDAINPASEPWSVAQLGTIYVREQASSGVCGNLREMWIRVGSGTDGCDWFSLAETRAVGNIAAAIAIADTIALTQTTDAADIQWEDLDVEFTSASASCDSVVHSSLARFTLPYSGLYRVGVYATGAPTTGDESLEYLASGFKYDSNYYTVGTGMFGTLQRAFANGQYVFYGAQGNTVEPAVWTSGENIEIDSASISLEYLG